MNTIIGWLRNSLESFLEILQDIFYFLKEVVVCLLMEYISRAGNPYETPLWILRFKDGDNIPIVFYLDKTCFLGREEVEEIYLPDGTTYKQYLNNIKHGTCD